MINAEPIVTGAPRWESVPLSFGPAIPWVLPLWLIRGAGSRQSRLGGFVRSKARHYQPADQGVTFADATKVDEARVEAAQIDASLPASRPALVLRHGGPRTHKSW